MLMVHIMLAGFFPCDEGQIESLDLGLGKLAAGSRRDSSPIPLKRRGVASAAELPGTIFLDFGPLQDDDPLKLLYGNVVGLVNDNLGTGEGLDLTVDDFRPRLPLMQFANLPPGVFSDAEEFARGVVEDTGLPESTSAWRLMLARFHSQAAGENWEPGSWSADISWELLSSHAL